MKKTTSVRVRADGRELEGLLTDLLESVLDNESRNIQKLTVTTKPSPYSYDRLFVAELRSVVIS